MSAAAPSLSDQQLYDLVSGPAPDTIAGVIARMQAIDALLPSNDGLKWFNRLYLNGDAAGRPATAWRRVAKPGLALSPRCRFRRSLL